MDAPDGSTLYATFDLTGAVLGHYGLMVSNGGRKITAPGLFTVETGVPGQVVFSLAVPSVMSYLRQQFVTVSYTNIGDTDAPAPLVALVGNDVAIRLPDDTSFDSAARSSSWRLTRTGRRVSCRRATAGRSRSRFTRRTRWAIQRSTSTSTRPRSTRSCRLLRWR